MEDIQNRLISLMDLSGKEDAEIERDLELPRSTVYDWRKGRSKSYKKYLAKLATYFEVSTDYLLGNEQKNKPLTEREKLNKECIDIMNSLPDDLRAVAHEQLKSLFALANKSEKK